MIATEPHVLRPGLTTVEALRKSWCWFLALGIALILLGFAAIASPMVATFVTVELFGILLLIGAFVELGSTIWARGWSGFFHHLLSGLLYLFLGVVLVERPGLGAAGYTLVLAVFFVASGMVRVAFALTHHFEGRGWTILSGAISVLLGVMIWRQLPESALWVIGTFVGIELVFNGITWVMLGLGLRKILSPVNRMAAEHHAPV
jgi:uncharacterized membrane protein HdeD (DUF308 family)